MKRINENMKIAIICEGFEEFEYLNAIISLNIWNNYSFKLINAESNGSIFPNYQYVYQNDDFDIVLIFADTDRPTYDDFKKLITKINEFHDVKEYAEEIIIFGNPCTMQIILNHFANSLISVPKANKKKNSSLISSLTGVADYDAHSEQRKQIFNRINLNNYHQMKKNLSTCSTSFETISSTNFLKFANRFESSDYQWIKDINKIID